MFSMGAAYPERSVAGNNVVMMPKVACCWVTATEEILNPMPIIAMINTVRLKYKNGTEP